MRYKGFNHKRILHSRMSDSFVPSNRPSLIDVSISITYSNNRCLEKTVGGGGKGLSMRLRGGVMNFF